MMLGALRRWWWRRGHAKFYATEAGRADEYSLNAGTRESFQVLVAHLVAVMAPEPSDMVLDLGGGTGRLSAEVFRGCRKVVVLDLCSASSIDASSFVIADMRWPPFRPGSFTKLFSYSTFPHVGSERTAKSLFTAWNALVAPGGVLFVGDVPDRARLSAVLARGLRGIGTAKGLKYYIAVSMISYFSKNRLKRWLEAMSYEVRVLRQSPDRRFHRERFDLVAKKRPPV